MLYQSISDDLKQAMKDKDAVRLSVLRMIKSRIMTVDARGEISDDEITKIIRSYQKTLKEAHEQAVNAKRDQDAEDLKKEMAIVDEYTPKAPAADEVRKLAAEIISKNNYSGKSDFGKVMKELMSTNKNIDGTLARAAIEDLLK